MKFGSIGMKRFTAAAQTDAAASTANAITAVGESALGRGPARCTGAPARGDGGRSGTYANRSHSRSSSTATEYVSSRPAMRPGSKGDTAFVKSRPTPGHANVGSMKTAAASTAGPAHAAVAATAPSTTRDEDRKSVV